MSEKIRTYDSDAIAVQYDIKRCIHAEVCVTRLRAVFDPQKRPWIQPANTPSVDELADVIEHCPSGALHHTRKDGGPAEATPETNSARLVKDGPVYVRGEIHIASADGTVTMTETRIGLCRCGASQNKPFCDNSHLNTGFTADAKADRAAAEPAATPASGPLTLTLNTNGPVTAAGRLIITDEAGRVIYDGDKTWLCRCGGSANKPFCDGTHKTNGFTG